MALLVFDDLTTGAEVYFDDLQAAPGIYYTQDGDAVVALAPDSSQSIVDIVEQPLDVTLEIFGGSPQEFLPDGGPGVYLQSASVQVIVYGGATHEFLSALVGSYTQATNAAITFLPASSQLHFAGVVPGEYLHQAAATVTFLPSALHQYVQYSDSVRAVLSFDSIGRFKDASPTTEVASFLPFSSRYISAVLSCADADWLAGLGPQGNPIRVELSLRRNGVRTPLASVSSATPRVDFFEGQTNDTAYQALRAAIAAGSLEIELGGYRALSDRALPISLSGPATLTVDMVP